MAQVEGDVWRQRKPRLPGMQMYVQSARLTLELQRHHLMILGGDDELARLRAQCGGRRHLEHIRLAHEESVACPIAQVAAAAVEDASVALAMLGGAALDDRAELLVVHVEGDAVGQRQRRRPVASAGLGVRRTDGHLAA